MAKKKKRGARGPAKGEGGRPPGPPTERLNWRLPVGTVAGIERLAKDAGLTAPAYLTALAGVQNDETRDGERKITANTTDHL